MAELTPDDRERIYQEEKARIEAQEQIKAESAQHKSEESQANAVKMRQAAEVKRKTDASENKVMFWACSALIVFLVALIWGCVHIFGLFSDNPGSSSGTTAATTSVDIGETGYITSGGGNVVVASDEQSEDDLTHSSVAKDDVGVDKMIESQRVYMVNGGTAAKLIGYGHGVLGFSVLHVRVVDGPYATQEGWIPMEWLKK